MFLCRICYLRERATSEWNTGEALEMEGKLCIDMTTARELTYLGDSKSAGGG